MDNHERPVLGGITLAQVDGEMLDAFHATGDLGEGTCGLFVNQPFVTDFNRREHRVSRTLITTAVDELRRALRGLQRRHRRWESR